MAPTVPPPPRLRREPRKDQFAAGPRRRSAGGIFVLKLQPICSRRHPPVRVFPSPGLQADSPGVGDDKWTMLPPHTDYQDCTYKGGFLYAVTIKGEIHAFDLCGPAVTMVIIRGMDVRVDFDAVYIVQAPWGGLLLVSRLIEIEDPADEDADPGIPLPKYTVGIKLHKVDVSTMRLVEVDCLPDHVLFLGHNQALCLSAKEYPTLKGNHAYFTDDDEYITGRKSCRVT